MFPLLPLSEFLEGLQFLQLLEDCSHVQLSSLVGCILLPPVDCLYSFSGSSWFGGSGPNGDCPLFKWSSYSSLVFISPSVTAIAMRKRENKTITHFIMYFIILWLCVSQTIC